MITEERLQELETDGRNACPMKAELARAYRALAALSNAPGSPRPQIQGLEGDAE